MTKLKKYHCERKKFHKPINYYMKINIKVNYYKKDDTSKQIF